MAQQTSCTTFKIPKCPAPQPTAEFQLWPPGKGPWLKKAFSALAAQGGPLASNLIQSARRKKWSPSSALFLSLFQNVTSMRRAVPDLASTFHSPGRRKRDCANSSGCSHAPCMSHKHSNVPTLKWSPVQQGLLQRALLCIGIP